MSVFLSKVLALFVQPLALGLVLLLVGLIAYRWKQRLSVACFTLALLVVWIPATPVVAAWLQGSLERRYPPQPVERVPGADAIVVLGGGVGPAVPPRLHPDLYAAADRVVHGARLFHAGKAPRIVVTGGFLKWWDDGVPEAEGMQQLLLELGVPADSILTESGSQTTRENATSTAVLLEAHGLERVLLVTSALHMRRAWATFRTAGIDAVPVATDIEVVDVGDRSLLRWMPDAHALDSSTRAIKERVGYFVYRWRGWIL